MVILLNAAAGGKAHIACVALVTPRWTPMLCGCRYARSIPAFPSLAIMSDKIQRQHTSVLLFKYPATVLLREKKNWNLGQCISRTPIIRSSHDGAQLQKRSCQSSDHHGRLVSGAFLPFFFQSGSCSPRAQLAMPPTSLPGRLGSPSSVSKISFRSCQIAENVPYLDAKHRRCSSLCCPTGWQRS